MNNTTTDLPARARAFDGDSDDDSRLRDADLSAPQARTTRAPPCIFGTSKSAPHRERPSSARFSWSDEYTCQTMHIVQETSTIDSRPRVSGEAPKKCWPVYRGRPCAIPSSDLLRRGAAPGDAGVRTAPLEIEAVERAARGE